MLTDHSSPSMHHGVLMRSKLEARWAAEFDRRGIEWEYEPRCPVAHYTPDFILPVLGVWVEVKPTRRQARYAKEAKLLELAQVLPADDVVALYGEPGDFGCHILLVPKGPLGGWREYRWPDYLKSKMVDLRRARRTGD